MTAPGGVRRWTPEDARQSLRRFIASHFDKKNEDHARFTIPASFDRDDDLILSRFIDQYEELAAALDAQKEEK